MQNYTITQNDFSTSTLVETTEGFVVTIGNHTIDFDNNWIYQSVESDEQPTNHTKTSAGLAAINETLQNRDRTKEVLMEIHKAERRIDKKLEEVLNLMVQVI